MKLFGRKKKELIAMADPNDEGMVGLYFTMLGKIEEEFSKFVREHLERLHQPGGYEREKKENDFMDLGMRRGIYLKALDDVEFSVVESTSIPQTRGRSRGKGQIITRWTVRGTHSRELLGIPPSGGPVTINGVTVTTFRDYRLRLEYTYWEFPELTRKVLGP